MWRWTPSPGALGGITGFPVSRQESESEGLGLQMQRARLEGGLALKMVEGVTGQACRWPLLVRRILP